MGPVEKRFDGISNLRDEKALSVAGGGEGGEAGRGVDIEQIAVGPDAQQGVRKGGEQFAVAEFGQTNQFVAFALQGNVLNGAVQNDATAVFEMRFADAAHPDRPAARGGERPFAIPGFAIADSAVQAASNGGGGRR